jgi:Tfp pilus assembly protein PilP
MGKTNCRIKQEAESSIDRQEMQLKEVLADMKGNWKEGMADITGR